jgi:hypothetical protein
MACLLFLLKSANAAWLHSTLKHKLREQSTCILEHEKKYCGCRNDPGSQSFRWFTIRCLDQKQSEKSPLAFRHSGQVVVGLTIRCLDRKQSENPVFNLTSHSHLVLDLLKWRPYSTYNSGDYRFGLCCDLRIGGRPTLNGREDDGLHRFPTKRTGW